MDTTPPLLSSSPVQVSNKEGSSTAAADAADFDAAGTSSAGIVVQSDGPMGQEVAVQPAGQELAAQSADVRNIEEQPGEVQKVLLQLSASSVAFTLFMRCSLASMHRLNLAHYEPGLFSADASVSML